MSESPACSCAIVTIVTYRCFTAGLWLVVAIVLLVASKEHDYLLAFVNEYMTIGKREIIKAALTQILSVSTTKMQFGSIVAVIYAAINAIEKHQQQKKMSGWWLLPSFD
jgi:hypothetical protein